MSSQQLAMEEENNVNSLVGGGTAGVPRISGNAVTTRKVLGREYYLIMPVMWSRDCLRVALVGLPASSGYSRSSGHCPPGGCASVSRKNY